MTPEQAYDWLAPKLSSPERQALDVIFTGIAAEREACANVCDNERAKFMAKAGENNGRESDFAFGSVNSAERIAAAIRSRSNNPLNRLDAAGGQSELK